MAVLGASGKGIKSVQRGTSTVSLGGTSDITITAIVLAKSFVNVSWAEGAGYGITSASAGIGGGGRFTTTTNLKLSAGTAYALSYSANPTAQWEVVEFE